MKAKFGSLAKVQARAFGPLLVGSLLGKRQRRPFSVHHVYLKPRGSHPALRHLATCEFFLILKGSIRARIGLRSRRMAAGDFAYLPPGCAHAFHAGKNGVEVLAVFSPPMDLRKPDIVHATKNK